MLNQLYGVVTPWAKSNKFQIIKNRVIGRLANYCYPVYCFVTPPTGKVTPKQKRFVGIV